MKKKIEFSKLMCVISIFLFIFSCLVGMASAFLGYDGSVFIYIIPSCAGLASLSVTAYLFKAKAENLSKQRIRFVLLKILLQDRLDPVSYQEILFEIENIDETINQKLNSMTVESIDGNEGYNSIGIGINNGIENVIDMNVVE